MSGSGGTMSPDPSSRMYMPVIVMVLGLLNVFLASSRSERLAGYKDRHTPPHRAAESRVPARSHPASECGQVIYYHIEAECVGGGDHRRVISSHVDDGQVRRDLLADINLGDSSSTARLAALGELGRADLPAEVAGSRRAHLRGSLTSRSGARPRCCAARPGPARRRCGRWIACWSGVG